MKVGMYFDSIASISQTQEEEYEEAEYLIREIFPERTRKLRFEHNVLPSHLANSTTKLYLFDIGGMGAYGGYTGVDSLLNELARQVEDRPNTLFVLWSSFTCKWFWDLVQSDYKQLTDAPNVLYRCDKTSICGDDAESWQSQLKEWFK
jgi:hypothetical protein